MEYLIAFFHHPITWLRAFGDMIPHWIADIRFGPNCECCHRERTVIIGRHWFDRRAYRFCTWHADQFRHDARLMS